MADDTPSSTPPPPTGQREPPSVITILGVMPRSGTNYLRDLLCLHRDCGIAPPIYEDYFVASIDDLLRFRDRTIKHWDREWGVTDETGDELIAHLSNGITDFLKEKAEPEAQQRLVDGGFELDPGAKPSPRIMVLKTPHVTNVRHVRRMPGWLPVVIVRDGRSVVYSGMKTFDWEFESVVGMWREQVRELEAARKEQPDLLVVRYENLIKDRDAELERILTHAGLSPDDIDLEAADNLPVRGSSALVDEGGAVHWRPVARTDDFRPLDRWMQWPKSLQRRFLWLAGDELRLLGYEPEGRSEIGAFWSLVYRIKDVWVLLRKGLRAMVARLLGR